MSIKVLSGLEKRKERMVGGNIHWSNTLFLPNIAIKKCNYSTFSMVDINLHTSCICSLPNRTTSIHPVRSPLIQCFSLCVFRGMTLITHPVEELNESPPVTCWTNGHQMINKIWNLLYQPFFGTQTQINFIWFLNKSFSSSLQKSINLRPLLSSAKSHSQWEGSRKAIDH